MATLIKTKGSKVIKKIDDWLYCNCATKVGYELTKWIGGSLLGLVSVITSVGGIVH